ncbi:hypothetical protein DY000_02041057, partial [Brassica cretica]
MAGTKGSESVRSLMNPGKSALLPPKIPFPSGLIGSRLSHKVSVEKAHQRTSSESHLVEEELPFWLHDLLNEPESPARKSGHRRSASDSYAYLDVANAATTISDFSYRNPAASIQRGIQELDPSQDASFYADGSFLKQRNRPSGARPSWTRESVGGGKHMGASSYMSQDATAETKRFSSEENNSNPQPGAYEADNTKRAKQQFAQRSRVRKLQYISELERNVQTLQAEGSKVSAELDFLNQRNLILSLENKALKHRLESIAQEKLIKQRKFLLQKNVLLSSFRDLKYEFSMEQEVLEREIGRLRALHQQQQHTRQQSASHKRASSKDLDSQFSTLSLNAKDSNCRRDSLSVM